MLEEIRKHKSVSSGAMVPYRSPSSVTITSLAVSGCFLCEEYCPWCTLMLKRAVLYRIHKNCTP